MTWDYLGKGIATAAVCAAGCYCMWLTKDNTDPTGIGWTIFGIALIYPFRALPIKMSVLIAEYAVKNKIIPFAYILTFFFAIPLIVIIMFK